MKYHKHFSNPSLTVIRPDRMTDRAFLDVPDLSELQQLELQGAQSIRGMAFGRMVNVQTLICNGCSGIDEDAVLAVIKEAQNLSYLDVLSTYSEETMMKINAVMRNGEKDFLINLGRASTLITWAKTQDLAPHLHLMDDSDYSADSDSDHDSDG